MNWLLLLFYSFGQQLACPVVLSHLNSKTKICNAKLPQLFNLALYFNFFLKASSDNALPATNERNIILNPFPVQ
ncbi:MAG: hypothetical protein RMX96_01365 [Nostoc sp. ChiSLP02]|nr:hypothetical protein [Nostoc sp. ChiSLP02]